MCYSARYLIEKALKRARHYNVSSDIELYLKKLREYNDWYQVSGFKHPGVIIYTNQEPYWPVLSHWGLIPHWVKNKQQANDIWNKTLNARCETIFDKNVFRDSAKNKRCIIPVEGFYEHHHFNNKKYPWYIYPFNGETMYLAGLWSQWVDKDADQIIHTYTIITTSANQFLAKIHNRGIEARMPAILQEAEVATWLNETDQQLLKRQLKPCPEVYLSAHTVKPLSGKKSPGNVPEANVYHVYEELESKLF